MTVAGSVAGEDGGLEEDGWAEGIGRSSASSSDSRLSRGEGVPSVRLGKGERDNSCDIYPLFNLVKS